MRKRRAFSPKFAGTNARDSFTSAPITCLRAENANPTLKAIPQIRSAFTANRSWQESAQWALDCCQEIGLLLKGKTVGARKLKDMTNWVARRPVFSVLSSAKYAKLTGRSPRTWREAVADYIRRFYSKKYKQTILLFPCRYSL